MENGYILAHDLGTSGNKVTLYDLYGNLVASSIYQYDTYYPKANWVEQAPDKWWTAVCNSTNDILNISNISNKQILCVSFSGQMMGCVPINSSGEILRNSIIWADQRSIKEADKIEKLIGNDQMYKITGHRICTSNLAAKLLWIKENESNIYNNISKVLNAKDYIIYKLTGNIVTDYSDACGTNLFNITSKEWSKDIISELDIPCDILPELHSSTDIGGYVNKAAALETGLLKGTPVIIGGGDGCCATVGAGAIENGEAYNSLGSSSWISIASDKPIYDKDMKTFNFVHLDKNLYSPCGAMQSAGIALKWIIKILNNSLKDDNIYNIISKKVLSSKPGADNLLFLPYLLGERSPRWDPYAKGTFIGLNVNHTDNDVYRAVIEGVIFNLKVILDAFCNEVAIERVIIIGGGAEGEVWLNTMANIWQKELLIPKYLQEATSMGAAVCGGVGINAFNNFNVIKKFNPIVKTIKPNKDLSKKYYQLYEIFNETYDSLTKVYKKLSNN